MGVLNKRLGVKNKRLAALNETFRHNKPNVLCFKLAYFMLVSIDNSFRAMSSSMQVQVQIEDTRRVLFITQPNSYAELIDAIKKEIPKIRYVNFSLLFENDEGEYVVLNEDPLCLRVAVLSSKTIPGTDIRRLKLKVFEGSSPTRESAEKDEDKDCEFALPVGINVGEKSSPTCTSVSIEDPCSSTKAKTISENTKVKDIINFNPNREDYDVHSDSSSNDSENSVDDDVQNKTPLERYVLITEKQIADKRVLLAELHEKENDIEKRINLVKASPSSGNICSNCHARLGHTARKCTMPKCTSVFNCREEKYHVGEINTREIRSQIRKHEMELNKLMTELENKKAATNASKDSLSRKIERDLFQTKKTDCLVNGNKNWSLLRKHVYAVEKYCKVHFEGRLPARQDISKILTNALSENNSLSYHRTKRSREQKRGNPFKHQLQNFGVQFPAAEDCIYSPPKKTEKVSSLLATTPTNQQEETEQLAFVMKESLRNHPQSKSFLTLSQSMHPWGQQASLTFEPFQGNFPADPLNMHYPTFYPYVQNYHPTQFFVPYPARIENQPKHCPDSNCFTSTSTTVNNATIAADNDNISGSYNIVRNDTSDGQTEQILDNNLPVDPSEDTYKFA